ncbi:hypothetical protein KQX54_015154 [Cotesia glomerata]|uniref:USP domain-containing protein n=1 Tax=Cotesia glomerata TaxID=32391 RepID=A0AAV7I2L2_COTGL|nr:hypothetical protein KQX54_015154 [Cotesia glomerata]
MPAWILKDNSLRDEKIVVEDIDEYQVEEIVSIQEDKIDQNLVDNDDDDKKPLNESDENLEDIDDDKTPLNESDENLEDIDHDKTPLNESDENLEDIDHDKKPLNESDESLLYNRDDKSINESDDEPLDESIYENWKGLGNDSKHKKFNWINTENFNNGENKDDNIQNNSAPVHKITKSKISNYNNNSEIKFEKANVQEYFATTISSNNSIDEDHCYSNKSPLVETHENKVESVVTSITRQIKKEGKYFQTCPDINLINDGVVKKLREMNKDNSKKGKKKNGITLESFGKIYQSKFQILYPIYKDRELTQANSENEDKDDNGKSLSRVIDCQDKITLNVYVYIELEMPETFNKKPKEAKLRDFPKHIILSEQNLLGERKQLRYRLCGVIGYANKHYVAYCQGLSGTWQFFNDLLSAPHAITSSASINPHEVLYILCHSSL